MISQVELHVYADDNDEKRIHAYASKSPKLQHGGGEYIKLVTIHMGETNF